MAKSSKTFKISNDDTSLSKGTENHVVDLSIHVRIFTHPPSLQVNLHASFSQRPYPLSQGFRSSSQVRRKRSGLLFVWVDGIRG